MRNAFLEGWRRQAGGRMSAADRRAALDHYVEMKRSEERHS
jgi:hypothetical protein